MSLLEFSLQHPFRIDRMGKWAELWEVRDGQAMLALEGGTQEMLVEVRRRVVSWVEDPQNTFTELGMQTRNGEMMLVAARVEQSGNQIVRYGIRSSTQEALLHFLKAFRGLSGKYWVHTLDHQFPPSLRLRNYSDIAMSFAPRLIDWKESGDPMTLYMSEENHRLKVCNFVVWSRETEHLMERSVRITPSADFPLAQGRRRMGTKDQL